MSQLRGIRLLDHRVRVLALQRNARDVAEALGDECLNITSLEDLLSLKYENFEIGEAVYSGLCSVWWANTVELDFSSHDVQGDILGSLDSCITVYGHVKRLIHQYGFDDAVVFNGRLPIMRAFVRACEATETPFWIHERGSDLERFSRIRNALPHDRSALRARIDGVCSGVPNSELLEVAASLYAERRTGVIRNWRSYTDLQQPGVIHAFAEGARVLTFFTSTVSEYVGLGPQWRSGLFADQYAGIRQLTSDFLQQDLCDCVVIRVHPNESNASVLQQYLGLESLDQRVTVLPPDSPVDSYALIDASRYVLTFSSTIGIEAAYSGAVSILLGNAAYQGSGSVYEPETYEEVLNLVRTNSPPLSNAGAIRYGYWLARHGESFKYAREPRLGGEVTFRGKSVLPLFVRFGQRVKTFEKKFRR